MSFEINLIFLIKLFFYMKDINFLQERFKYLENKKSFLTFHA